MENVVCFHNPEDENAYLSNWYLSDFEVDGKKFTSMEQYMMYKKAWVFDDVEIMGKVMKETTNFKQIKALGRQVKNYDDKVWGGVRQLIIYEGLLAKFSQNPDLREALLSTGDALLVECAVRDTIWACGLSIKDSARFDISKWKGKNLLGFALMMVREKLKVGA